MERWSWNQKCCRIGCLPVLWDKAYKRSSQAQRQMQAHSTLSHAALLWQMGALSTRLLSAARRSSPSWVITTISKSLKKNDFSRVVTPLITSVVTCLKDRSNLNRRMISTIEEHRLGTEARRILHPQRRKFRVWGSIDCRVFGIGIDLEVDSVKDKWLHFYF